jgi:anti-sigma-K factor RskA
VSEHRDEHLDLCAGDALGNLDAADRVRLEEHLAGGCPVCEAALEQFGMSVVAIAASAPPASPSAALRERVLAAARADRAPGERATFADVGSPARGRVIEMRPRRPMFGLTVAWGAVAAALAIATAISWMAANRLQTELAGTRRQLAEAQQQLADERRWAAVLNAPDARVAELSITPAGLRALRARATFDPGTRSAVLVFENFTPPSGKDYELWAMREAGVRSLGLIKADASGRAVMHVADLGDPATLAGFAVSLENQGGSGNPTAPGGPVVMAGKLGTE